MMQVLDLFSGIGGFAIASHWAGFATTQFVEIDPWNQKLLNQNFPGIPCHDDITTFTASPGQFDIITGGFPCQDISSANPNGAGLAGKRSGLFYEIIRLVCECRPRYVVLENVSALLSKHDGRDMGTVLWAISECGYDAEWQTISAASMGAPHLRERIFIVAYPKSSGHKTQSQKRVEQLRERTSNALASCYWNSSTPNANSHQRQRREQISDGQDGAQNSDTQRGGSFTPNPQSSRRRPPRYQDDEAGSNQAPVCGSEQRQEGSTKPRICGMDDGLSYWVDTTQPAPLSVRTPDRKHRLKALGNAVTPQQALVPLLRIKQLIKYHATQTSIPTERANSQRLPLV